MADESTPSAVRAIAALAGGAVLSFLAFGVLWIGTPWHLQVLMGIAFFILTWVLTRGVPAAANSLFGLVMVGASPLGLLMMRFRDKNDSHLFPILIVCSWVAGAALGWFLNRRQERI